MGDNGVFGRGRGMVRAKLGDCTSLLSLGQVIVLHADELIFSDLNFVSTYRLWKIGLLPNQNNVHKNYTMDKYHNAK